MPADTLQQPPTDLELALVARELELECRSRRTLPLVGASLLTFGLALLLGPAAPCVWWLAVWLVAVLPLFLGATLAYQGMLSVAMLERPSEYTAARLMLTLGQDLRHPGVDNVGSWATFAAMPALLLGAALLLASARLAGTEWGLTGLLLFVFAALLHLPLFFTVDRVLWRAHGRKALERRGDVSLDQAMLRAGYLRARWRGWVRDT